MKSIHKHLLRQQLDATLDRIACLRTAPRPVKGWLRSIREALGMSGKQFAQRLGVSPSWITNLEKKELTGSVTIKTLRQAAEALDCTLVYVLVPRVSLDESVRKRAEILAQRRQENISHSMLLEAQELTADQQKKALEADVEELIRNMPKKLWDNGNNFL